MCLTVDHSRFPGNIIEQSPGLLSKLYFENRQGSTLNRQTQARGFTLLEVIISLGILSVIFSLLYGTFNAVYQGGEQMEAEADVYRLVRIATYHMANNLSMVYVNPTSSERRVILQGKDREHLIKDDNYSNDSLQFVALSHDRTMADAPESEQATIRYLLNGDKLIQEMALSNGRLLSYELGGPLAGLNFRYFDATKKKWVESWGNEGDDLLPLAVEIEFVVNRADRETRKFRTWVDLP